MKDNIKRITFELDADVFYKLKQLCLENRTTVKDFLTNIIQEKIK